MLVREELSVKQGHRDYFDGRLKKAQQFCRRFDGGIDFRGKKVLDFGCGHGALSVYAAQAGAREVTGLDVNTGLVEAAGAEIAQRFPALTERIELKSCDMKDFKGYDFDIVVSQATLEHVLDVEECLRRVKELLKEGGAFYVGFGPLYHAPWGDHRRSEAPLQALFPWAHLCFSKEWIVKRYNARHPDKKIGSFYDFGLNGLKFEDYLRLMKESGLTIASLKVNVARHPLVPVINALRRIPGMSELLTFNVYALLEKRLQR